MPTPHLHGHVRSACVLLLGVAAFAWPLASDAWQVNPPAAPPAPLLVISPPPAAVQFQQIMQQQQVRDQLQKRQLESSLQQSVREHAGRAHGQDPLTRLHADQAAQAQRDRDRAAQQDLLNRYRQTTVAPPTLQVAPATSRSSG